jgi:hypothetical protein
MALIDIQERIGPKRDRLGHSCLIFHMAVGAFVLAGWLISSSEGLLFYLLLLPAMATQWAVNRGSCVINNIETWLRTGRWRDQENGEDGRYLAMLFDWLFAVRPAPAALDRLSYSTVLFLWVLGLGHFFSLTLA